MSRTIDAFEHAERTAHEWLADVARALDTDDRRFAYRVLRAWLHALRDRLTVDNAAAFAAQLPELLRGVYYDGWRPHHVPVKYGPDEYVQRFAREACVGVDDVRRLSATIAGALAARFSPGHLDERLAHLPEGVRVLIGGGPDLDRAPSTDQSGRTTEQELADLNTRLDALATAMRTLTTGFDEPPGEGLDEQRLARASRLAGEILLAAERPATASTSV